MIYLFRWPMNPHMGIWTWDFENDNEVIYCGQCNKVFYGHGDYEKAMRLRK